MRVFPVVLALAACSEQQATNRSGQTQEVAQSAGWADHVGRSVAAANHAPVQVEPGFWRAADPQSGVVAWFDEAGAHFASEDAEFSLRVASVGRSSGAMELDAVEPEPGIPVFAAVDPAGNDLPVVAWERAGLSEWWTGSPDGFEHGWTLGERPDGVGPVRFGLALTGASAASAGLDVELIDDANRTWRYADLLATDARGHAVPAAFSVADGQLGVVMDDAGATYPIDVDPVLTTASSTLTGPSAYSYFGNSIARGGDVNGDGFDDLVVGAPYAAYTTGRAYIYHGSASGFSTTASTTIATGGSYLAYCGATVAGGGDVSNDGFDDVAVNCSGSDVTWVYSGSSSGVSTTASLTLTGSSSSDLGAGLALDGDVNSDGYADLLVGAPAQSTSKGRVYVYPGSASGLGSSSTSIDGPKNSSKFGAVLSYAGDVDGDGYDDVLVGAPSYSTSTVYYTGRFSLYKGASTGLNTAAQFSANGSGASAYLGYSLAGGGDLNGDGYDDVIVGRNTSSGTATVYYGSSAALTSSAYTNLTLSGSYYFGKAVAIVADVDDDGDDEAAIAAPTSGKVEVHAGTSSGVSATALSTMTSSSTTFGNALCALDANGDGYGDLAIADPADSSTYGKVYLHLGYVDNDGDGYIAGGDGSKADCDDTDAAINPDATEILGDGVDQDCDGMEDCYADLDGDGYLDGSGTLVASIDVDCSDPGEATASAPTGDCDDTDPNVYTGATEIVGNGIDEDCDGEELCFDDDDRDGYLDSTGDTLVSPDLDCTDPGEGTNTTPTTDCNDSSYAENPGATESPADGVDGDCDGLELCYADADGDHYRTSGTVVSADTDCLDSGEAIASDPATDCDDTSASVHPGATETVGDEIDEDCDGLEACYSDTDGDGSYPPTGPISSLDADCDDAGEIASSGSAGDCDDADATRHPGATEVTGDEVDSDCDTAETCWLDGDRDGYHGTNTVASGDSDCADPGEHASSDPDGDCDDANASAWPGATEITADEVDEDCDGTELCYADADNDRYRGSSSVASADADCADSGEAALATTSGDCNDADSAINPGETEIVGDGVDSDCTATEICYLDYDNDGYVKDGETYISYDTDCLDAHEGTSGDPGGDCDDNASSVHPGATDKTADELDSDCDGIERCYADGDADGYRTGETVESVDAACDGSGEADSSVAAGDCDDADSAVYPGATEVVGDEVDEDCDGREVCYEDADGDGVRTEETVESGDDACDAAGFASSGADAGDCDDGDATIFPGATDAAGDGVDSDCDGTEQCFVDGDGDGWRPDESATVASTDTDCVDVGEAGSGAGTGDCDDADPAYYPTAPEADCTDPNDYNCDGSTGHADLDADGWAACEECDDGNADRYPGAIEEVGDAVDQDCDGAEVCYVDADADAHRSMGGETVDSTDEDCDDAGEAPSVLTPDDCDDADPTKYPGATEQIGDEADSDCDGGEVCFADGDGDGYRDESSASLSSSDTDCSDAGEASAAGALGDCDDTDAAYHPGADELDCTDPNDYNCDGSAGRVDGDGDGYAACEECDDGASTVNPAATEICNEIDDNCDSVVDADAVDQYTFYADTDGDGFGDPAVPLNECVRPDGWVADSTDCDDTNATVNPDADEVADDGVDQDCDGADLIGPADTGDTGGANDSATDDSGNPDIVPDDSGEVVRTGGLYGGLSCDATGGAASAGALFIALAGLARRRRSPSRG